MKRMIKVALCTMMVLSFVGCGKTNKEQNNPKVSGEKTEVANPITACESVEEAEKLVGFDITVTDSIEGYDSREVQVINKELIEVIYSKGDEEVRIRKAAGSEDISGDYTNYSENNVVAVGELQVTMKGNDGQIDSATWTNGDYTYSISTNGMSVDAVTELVLSIQ